MKAKDLFWVLTLGAITGFVMIPITNALFTQATTAYPYLMGFIKTAILATMGEMLVMRIKSGNYLVGKELFLKAIVWGFLGMIFVLIFKVFSAGVESAQASQLLPMISQNETLNLIWLAFLISLIMNLCFAPSFMLLHRITDGFIEQANGSLRHIKNVSLKRVVDAIDFNRFFGFALFKTIPLFWIPAHTITFILPETYRVLMASYLSIVLGILLTIAKKK